MNKQWSNEFLWKRFKTHYSYYPSLGLSLDLSRMAFPDDFLPSMGTSLKNALTEMQKLESGAIANPDEKRMVGHYWLRHAKLAPNPKIQDDIESTIAHIKTFAADVHHGKRRGADGHFENLLVIGIGGSALGPQFVANALGHPKKDKLKPFFLDNTDPDGMDKVFALLENQLGKTLTIVISKSGGTKETRNGMLETKRAYEQAHLKFEDHAVAITGEQSELDQIANRDQWIIRFPMWDWVGGRTSETSVVGLLPAALQGIDIDGILKGAQACDELTRTMEYKSNPAAQLALMWYYGTNGKGDNSMVILPYKDRLKLFPKYLQQLIMESLGKEKDLNGTIVCQGITVYGNKGSTDQHAYVQQLRDGIPHFFVTFIRILKDRDTSSVDVEPQVTSGDYLFGFLQGTRKALFDNDRQSLCITIQEISPFTIGVLIALYERAVGIYAQLININAYHQPGVEAGKKAAGEIIRLQVNVLDFLKANTGKALTIYEIADALRQEIREEDIFSICEHLAANPDRGIRKADGGDFFNATYRYQKPS